MIRHLHGPKPRGVVPDVVCEARPLRRNEAGSWVSRALEVDEARNAPSLTEPDEPRPVVVHHPATPLAIGACCPWCGVRA